MIGPDGAIRGSEDERYSRLTFDEPTFRGGPYIGHIDLHAANAPPAAEHVVGYLDGGREGVFDAQWARHQAASHVGDDLAAVDAVHYALLDGYDDALVQARRAVDQAGTAG